ncbi:cytoplasmic polyadenylation element-binding protein 2-like [Littorina saxatilis]|uniref:RRM domain-containing protein n=1 Tax=Littorina saxatilis TaxID=31220 RepID=A0AAN9BTG3_9CAEN
MGEFGLQGNAYVRALSPQGQQTDQSLFSDSVPSGKMQDDTLLEKSSAKQISSNTVHSNDTEHIVDEANRNLKNGIAGHLQEEKKRDILNSSPLHLVLSSADHTVPSVSVTPVTSFSSAAALDLHHWSGPPDDSIYQGYPSVNGAVSFQQFAAAPNTVFSQTRGGFAVGHVGMTGAHQQPASRRAITAHHNFPQRQTNFMLSNPKTYQNWSTNAHQAPVTWPPGQQGQATLCPWGGMPPQHQRRSVPNLNAISPMGAFKKAALQQQIQQHQQQALMAPSKFRRSTSFSGQIHQAATGVKQDFGTFDDLAMHKEGFISYQERGGQFDTMKFPTLENQLLDIMRNASLEQQHESFRSKIPYLIEENHIIDDGSLDQTVPNLSSPPHSSPNSGQEKNERFSRKVFVGGLPPDIDEEEITAAFRRFGPLVVDWPHKAESKSYFPPKGYCFLIFQDELSVQNLIEMCLVDDDKLYWCVSSPTMKDKPVQIRPWTLSDSDFVMDGSQPLDPRKTIFVGGVPRPLRAVELAMIMDRLYGGVCYAGIDTDPELKYPKGAGRVAFSNQQSYIAAISARFVQLQHGDIDKRVEVKPYVLDDQMCDECHGSRCAGKFAPFFCANVTCLQYYCEYCWAQIHSRPGREFHKPLVKEGADRPRAVPFRWC